MNRTITLHHISDHMCFRFVSPNTIEQTQSNEVISFTDLANTTFDFANWEFNVIPKKCLWHEDDPSNQDLKIANGFVYSYQGVDDGEFYDGPIMYFANGKLLTVIPKGVNADLHVNIPPSPSQALTAHFDRSSQFLNSLSLLFKSLQPKETAYLKAENLSLSLALELYFWKRCHPDQFKKICFDTAPSAAWRRYAANLGLEMNINESAKHDEHSLAADIPPSIITLLIEKVNQHQVLIPKGISQD